MRRADGLAGAVRLGVLTTSIFLLGCHSFWQGLLDPSQVGRFEQPGVSHDIRTVLSIQDEPPGIPNATEPTPEDTVVTIQEYAIGPGDVVDVIIYELLQVGVPDFQRVQVTDVGYVTLTGVGPVKMGGKTARQLELYLMERLEGTLNEPDVRVVVQDRRHRTFNILGGVGRPASYPIPRPDFRLLDALAFAGDLSPNIQEIYVLRSPPSAVQIPPELEKLYQIPDTTQRGEPEGMGLDVAAEPLAPLLSDVSPATVLGEPQTRPAVPSTGLGAEQRQELLEALGPIQPAARQPVAPASKPALSTTKAAEFEEPAPPLSKWLWLNGEWVEVRPDQEEPTQVQEAAAPAGEPTEDELDWEALAEPADETRVIAIPVAALLEGQARYNVVIHGGDVIRVPFVTIGEFYMMGHVLRPGVYSLTGREITLKQAIAAAGGLSPFAWPSRCELIRRIGRDREEVVQINLDRVFAGKDPDVFLRPNDVINVGTHALAPFLVVIRNSFRMSYGFGFVYDRNFADIDSFGSQANPRDRRRFEGAGVFR